MTDDITQRVDVVFTTKDQEKVLKATQRLQGAIDEIANTPLGNKLSAGLKGVESAFKGASGASKEYQSQINKVIADEGALTKRTQQRADAVRNLAVAESEAAKAAQGGRNYRNTSTTIDSAISQGQDIRAQELGSLKAQILARDADAKAAQKQATAINGASAATAGMAGNLPRLRYALYDVSTTFAIAGAAALAFGVAVAGTAITMDRQFADVVRTTGTYMDETGRQTAALRSEFNELFTTLPVSFRDLADIGTLAGQLGVAQQDVAEFTSLVAKFGAVTDVSVEASATAFGRLSTLLDVPAKQYENLGSSILSVGVASVATESQIINTASQIASMGSFAGFSADEVIGLSSALASLGVQPELSRGVVTRLFTNITEAVSEGGEKLEAFGRTAGTSGAEFADAWGTDAAAALQTLLAGLGSIEDSGAIAALNSMGITASRDIPTLLKLAQNHELVAEQMAIAAQGYAEGTSLQEQYGVIAETVAEKLTVLRNNVQQLIGAFGESSSTLGPFIDILTKIIGSMARFVSTPVGQVIALLAVSFSVLGGVLAVIAGGAARGAAGLLAMSTAAKDLTGSGATAAISLRGLQTQLEGAGVAGRTAALSIRGIRAALISTGIGAAIVALGTAWSFFSEKVGASKRAVDDLAAAIVTDTRAGDGVVITGKKVIDYGRVLSDVRLTQDQWNDVLYGSSTYAEEYAKSVDVARGSVEDFEAVIGDAAKTNITDAFQDSDFLKTAFEAGVIPENLDFSALTDALVLEGQTGGEKYLDAIFDPDRLTARALELNTALQNASEDYIGSEQQDFDSAELDKTMSALALYNNLLAKTTETSTNFSKAVDDARYANLFMAESTDEASNAATTAAASMEEYEGSLADMASSVFDMVNLNADLGQSLYDLGASVYENGNSFDAYSQSGRQNLQALQDVFASTAEWAAANGVTFEDAMAQVGGAMVQAGVISVEQLAALGVQSVTYGNTLLSVAEATSQAVAQLQAQMANLQSANSGLSRGQAADGLRYAGQALAIIEGGGEAAKTAVESMGYSFERIQAPALETGNLLGQISDGWNDAGKAAQASGGKQKKAGKDTADSAKEAAEEVRTLLDYTSDLTSLLGDTYDFQFGFDEASDGLADANQAMVDYFVEAQEQVDEYTKGLRDAKLEVKSINAELKTLAADRSLLEYQLSVAVEYGDTIRAAEITALLGENASDTADANADLQDANKDVAQSAKDLDEAVIALIPDLSGLTEASRKQRDIQRDIIKANEAAIVAYANTGASQKDVAKFAKQLGVDYKEQGKQAGYSTDQLKTYTTGMGEFAKVVEALPRDLTVEVDAKTSAADKAIKEWTAKKRSTKVDVRTPDQTSKGRADAANYKKGWGSPKLPVGFDDRGAKKAARAAKIVADITYMTQQLASAVARNATSYETNSRKESIATLSRLLASGAYYTGGYTGRGGKYDVAGTVHKGEYVVPKRDVNQATGLPYADAFNRIARGASSPAGYADGGSVRGSGAMMAELSPTDRKLLRDIRDNVGVYLDGREITRTVNRVNKQSRAVGV